MHIYSSPALCRSGIIQSIQPPNLGQELRTVKEKQNAEIPGYIQTYSNYLWPWHGKQICRQRSEVAHVHLLPIATVERPAWSHPRGSSGSGSAACSCAPWMQLNLLPKVSKEVLLSLWLVPLNIADLSSIFSSETAMSFDDRFHCNDALQTIQHVQNYVPSSTFNASLV